MRAAGLAKELDFSYGEAFCFEEIDFPSALDRGIDERLDFPNLHVADFKIELAA